MSEERRSPFPLLFVISVLLVAAASIAWWLQHRDSEDPTGEAIAREDALELLALKHDGLGKLENGDYDEAAKTFEIIVEKLPDDPLGHRNLAIARMLSFEELLKNPKATPAQKQAARKTTSNAVDAAIEAEPKSAAVRYLASRFYSWIAEQSGNDKWRNLERDALKQASELDPDAIYVWYRRFDSHNFDFGKEATKHQVPYLKRAHKVRPRNVVLLGELLKALVEIKDAELPGFWTIAEKLVRPIALRMRDPERKKNLLQLLDEATAALKSKDAKKRADGGLKINFAANVIKGTHAFQLDMRELRPHELEFVISDFGDGFYERADLPEPELPEAIAVKFEPATPAWSFPKLEDARDLKLIDFDLDTDIDLLVAHGKSVSASRHSAAKKSWEPIATIELQFEPHGLIAADLDFDVPDAAGGKQANAKPKQPVPPKNPCITADVDVVAWGPGGIAVLRNELDKTTGRRSLQPVKQPDEFQKLKDVLRVVVADFDHDSDLDLIVSTKSGISLWTNRGDMTFQDDTPYSELPPAKQRATGLVPIDFNRDVLIDVVVTGPKFESAGYMENIRHGRFRYREFDQKFAPLASANTLCALDADANVSWDFVAAGKNGISLVRSRTVGNGRYQFLKSSVIHKQPVRGAAVFDYDNDGFQDIIAWSPAGLLAFRGGPDGVFQPAEDLLPKNFKDVTAVASEDVDGDGDLDLAVVAGGRGRLLLNAGGNKNNWLRVTLHAQDLVEFPIQRCNIHGVGSLMELKAGTGYQARTVTSPVTHFGLGNRKTADVVRVLWTNGIPQNVLKPDSRQAVCSLQNLSKGSCPYLYVWNGEKWEFLYDCLWAAPLGLQFADGVIAPSRPWEYLKIPGDRLKASDGEYRLLVTEELWEAAYFDTVRLYAIDHPADVQIYTNEKVGPAAIAARKIHTVRRPRIPVAARNQLGRDVLPLIAKRDGRHMQGYPHRIAQGLTPPHYLELDLGRLKNPRRIMLYLSGWIFPSDTSINVWLSRHPNRPSPQPPSLWVPDKKGDWKKVVPYTGFPGGKSKTIALDLSKVFLTNDYRVRIQTTMEIRWDAAFFTVDEPPAKFTRTPLALKRADLFYRGFSRRIDGRDNGPETYDATQVDPSPKWPPMDGRFTRYGDVTDILKKQNDQLVVMGAGDAMELRFAVPKKPLLKGWKRDFVIYSVGWDKDADLNTVLGQSSEPLPWVSMRQYPLAPDDPPPSSRAYREYLRKYQTRRQRAPRFWRLPARR